MRKFISLGNGQYEEIPDRIEPFPAEEFAKEYEVDGFEAIADVFVNDEHHYIGKQVGHWCITDAWPHKVYCSVCYKTFAQENWEVWKDGSLPRNFCPNCGALMKGVKDDSDTEVQ